MYLFRLLLEESIPYVYGQVEETAPFIITMQLYVFALYKDYHVPYMGHWHFIDHLLQFLFSNSRITEIVLDPIILLQPEVDNKGALDWRIRPGQASRERSQLRAAQKRERERVYFRQLAPG